MLHALTVLHARKGAGCVGRPEGLADPTAAETILELETCQRWIQVIRGRRRPPRTAQGGAPDGLECYSGPDAYAFLLRVTTGLASELAGETNIFGQVKRAWSPHLHREVWLQCLLEDAKDIRSRYLSGLGGHSYGRLVRQCLPEDPSLADRPLLLLGAGDLAHSVAPWLRHRPLLLWNRNEDRAVAFARSLEARPGAAVTVVRGPELPAALDEAGAIIACIPFDAAPVPVSCKASGDRRPPRVIHLGGARHEAGEWRSVRDLVCLDDLFARHSAEDADRLRRLRQATDACTERARLRALGKSLSIAHGWEDLAVFAMPDREPMLFAA
jgi:hypothetical protein